MRGVQMIFLGAFILLAQLALALEAPMSLQTLSRNSDRIVRGKVTNVGYLQGTNEYGDQLIYTNVSIRVEEALKGDRSDFVLTVEGGTLNGITLEVSDAAKFNLGEEVLVFAKKDVPVFHPVSGSRSKYTIGKDGLVVENRTYYGAFRKQILEAIHNDRSVQ
jgi:hypothetical protein